MDDELLTRQEVANMMKVTTRTVNNWQLLGRLVPRRMTKGTVRFRRSEVLEAMDRFEYGGDPPRDPGLG